MDNVTYAYLGVPDAPGRLAKRGTASDVILYNGKQGDVHLNLVAPLNYPERIGGLLASLDVAQRIVLHPSAVDRLLGEKIVGAELFGRTQGFLRCEDPTLGETVAGLLARTTLAGLQLDSGPEAVFREKLYADPPAPPADGPTVLAIDHSFPVKGIGTVVLGLVRRGTIRRHQSLRIYPTDATVDVRSIQVHDVDYDAAAAGSRVGLALKGVEPHDVRRGRILADGDALTVVPAGQSVVVDVATTPHNRWRARSGTTLHAYHVLQDVVLRVDEVEAGGQQALRITGRPDAPLTWVDGEPLVLVDLDNPAQRFVGRGMLRQA